ncbi:MAG TPA: tRNA 2-thiouridine(34) synthase MnmA [Deferrisomatales bacterium]|nr:tRNA 2-thiouridine(34) synthase MnmA [Deferrisomatales bacterium]
MRVALGMSGGVDSSAAAVVLCDQGHQVVGFTLKVWDRSRCCSLEDVADARRVAARLDLPFYVLDAHEVFQRQVVEPFVAAYAAGTTPNPCIWCNQRVKFRWLLERARALGCDAVATGHYARLVDGPGGRRLLRGVDRAKDQSYFLVPDAPDGLDRVLFPLGEWTKDQVRALAAGAGLPVARKADSQDVCFVPEGDLAGFLARHLPRREGEIVDRQGRVLGHHRGVHGYTVGQRRGLGVSAPEPLYVIDCDPSTARVVVAPRRALWAGGLVGEGAVWLPGAEDRVTLACTVQLRSTGHAAPCRVERHGDQVRVLFEAPQFGVAPGQMAVFYAGDEVLGGAWITSAVSGEQ